MAEEASAPEQPRGRLHGVQREPHEPAAGQGDRGAFLRRAAPSGGRADRPGAELQIELLRRGLTRRDGPMMAAPVVDAAASFFFRLFFG